MRSSQVVEYLAERALSHRVTTDADITGQAQLSPGLPGHLSFASRADDKIATDVRHSRSSLLLVLPQYEEVAPVSADVIVVSDPRLEFARVVHHFFSQRLPGEVHERAVVHESAVLGPEALIGPGAVISEGCRIGARATVGANAVILPGTVLGDDVTIGPGAVIGHTGFGYSREADGTPVLIPHTGGVVVGDRVEIGANAAIDRGTIGDTVIESDAKIDNLVHIAHNCHIGSGAFVIATAILCGGVVVGEGAWISPNATVRQKLKVGSGSIVGLSATVIHDVEPHSTVVGSPARRLPS